MRLKLEKRRAEREGNFESAALVLGLAERNQATKEEQYVFIVIGFSYSDCQLSLKISISSYMNFTAKEI